MRVLASCFVFTFLIVSVSVSTAKDFELTLKGENKAAWPSVSGGLSGNPVVQFNGTLFDSRSVKDRFNDPPRWIVSEDFDSDGKDELAVLFGDGTLRFISFENERMKTISTIRNLAPEAPPVVLLEFDGQEYNGVLVINERGDMLAASMNSGRTKRLENGFSTLTHPLVADLDKDGEFEIAAVSEEGHLTIIKSRSKSRKETGADIIPDSRITASDLDGDGELEIIALTSPVDEPGLGRLGDDIEAGAVAVFSWDGRSVKMEKELVLDTGTVFEAITPFIAEGVGDSRNLIVLPVNVEGSASQLRTYSYSKSRIREVRKGPEIRGGSLIQIAGISDLGNNDKSYIIAVTDPSGSKPILELFRDDLAGTRLSIEGEISTQAPGTRLTGTAIIGDFDDNGSHDMLAPDDERKALRIFSLERNRIQFREIYNGGDEITSNLCPGDLNGDGWTDVAVGFEDGSLVILLGH